MRRLRRLVLLLAAPIGSLAAQNAVTSQRALRITAQGMIREDTMAITSPRGAYRLEMFPRSGDEHVLSFDLAITDARGVVRRLLDVSGSAFFITDDARVVAIETCESASVASRIAVFDSFGRQSRTELVHGMISPELSADGRRLLYGTSASTTALDLRTFESARYPRCDVFAGGANGSVVGWDAAEGMLFIAGGSGSRISFPFGDRVRGLAFTSANEAVLVLTNDAVTRIDVATGARTAIFTAPPGSELRDLRLREPTIAVGMRTLRADRSIGELLILALDGRIARLGDRLTSGVPHAITPALPAGRIPWPLLPALQHSVGNTYGEFQDYGSDYLHPGIDIFGSDGQAVFAVRAGVVKAILTTAAEYHWRIAIGDSDTPAKTAGYLYAHIDAPTIAVNVGDVVTRGQYLGDLVPWPVAGFTHTHFARIEDTGSQWHGSWLCTENPHPHLWPQTETEAPVFENARTSQLFAFCVNQTSTYLNPAALSGSVDIIAHVGDRIATTWVCAVQTIRYSIYPAGDPHNPIVDDKLAVVFDMPLDTYQGGPIDPFLVDLLYQEDATCNSDGDYVSREFFHIITNSNGDQIYDDADLAEAWNTTLVSDGDYVISVTAADVAGNATTAAMTVTVDNG